MAVEDRVRSLREKHASLKEWIGRESSRPLPDDFKVAEWKREKLRIKDTLAELGRELHP
jgi:hypothetical protein